MSISSPLLLQQQSTSDITLDMEQSSSNHSPKGTKIMTDQSKATHEITKQIAAHLDGWVYDETKGRSKDDGALYPTALLICQDKTNEAHGFSIRVSPEWNSTKLEIGLAISQEDHQMYLREKCKAIGCSSAKSPKQIARDIDRRLLPAMSAPIEEIRTRRAQHTEYEDGLTKTRKEMLKSPHVTEWGTDRDGRKGLKVVTAAKDYGHEIDVSSDGTVKLTLGDLTPAQARKILAMLNPTSA